MSFVKKAVTYCVVGFSILLFGLYVGLLANIAWLYSFTDKVEDKNGVIPSAVVFAKKFNFPPPHTVRYSRQIFAYTRCKNGEFEFEEVVEDGKIYAYPRCKNDELEFGENVREYIDVRRLGLFERQERSFSYKNGELISARIGHNRIRDPEMLKPLEEEALNLLAKTRQDFSDTMPLN